MKIDIYVQRDFSALVVPSGCDLSKLPENIRSMVLPPSDKKEGRDTAQHLIALDDVKQVMAGIDKDGYYINRPGNGKHRLRKLLENVDKRNHFTSTARRVPDTEEVKTNK